MLSWPHQIRFGRTAQAGTTGKGIGIKSKAGFMAGLFHVRPYAMPIGKRKPPPYPIQKDWVSAHQSLRQLHLSGPARTPREGRTNQKFL